MAMYVVTKAGELLGLCIEERNGWRFRPQTSAHKGSRKDWPSAAACIPRWALSKSASLLTREEWDRLQQKRAAHA